MLSILYDGWPLVWQPNGPAAMHLCTLLAYLPDELQAQVALPGQPVHALPEGVIRQVLPTREDEASRLRWEQRRLPRLARELGVDFLHLTSSHPALFGRARTLISPTGYPWRREEDRRAGRKPGLATRLREALSQGGMERVHALLWPEDLPEPDLSLPVLKLPPALHPVFGSVNGNGQMARVEQSLMAGSAALDLPETFLLYHGPHGLQDLRSLLEAWSWAAGSIGDYYPLLLLGLDEQARKALPALAQKYQLGETVRAIPPVSIETLGLLYRKCTALFHPAGVSPWGGAIRPALSCGKPVVALKSELAEALVGPAAYLVPEDGKPAEGSGRALGAALITVVVEESVAEGLRQAAYQRAARWRGAEFRQALLAAYQSLAFH